MMKRVHILRGRAVLEERRHLPFQVVDASAIEGIRGLVGESSSIHTHTHTHIYIHTSKLHPSPQLYVAPPYDCKVRAKGTTWCINVAEGAKLGQNGLKMGSKHLFEHPQWSRITFGKTHFSPLFHPSLLPKQPPFKAFLGFSMGKNTSPWAQNGLKKLV